MPVFLSLFCFVLLCFLLTAWIIYYAKCIVENIIFSPIIHLNLESNACVTEINVDLIINNTKIKDNQLRTVQCLDVFHEHKPRNWRDDFSIPRGLGILHCSCFVPHPAHFSVSNHPPLAKKKGWSCFLSAELSPTILTLRCSWPPLSDLVKKRPCIQLSDYSISHLVISLKLPKIWTEIIWYNPYYYLRNVGK